MRRDYDFKKDSIESWKLAVAELRKKGLREGRFVPVNDEERAYLAERERGIWAL